MSLEFLWISATVLTFGTLALAGHRHLRDESSLGTTLHLLFGIRRHSCHVLARLVGCYEFALGSAGLVCAVVGPRVLLRILTSLALVTFILYTCHVVSLFARGVEVPCGCGSETGPANGGTVARTLALAFAAAFALLALGDVTTFQSAPGVVLLAGALAGATFTSLLWSLPSAMAGLPPKAAGGRDQLLGLPPKAAGGRDQLLGLPPKAVGGQGQVRPDRREER